MPPSGRSSTESRLKGGHPAAESGVRRCAGGGYTARFSGLTHPPSNGSSPTAGTTSRSRARVAAT